MFDSSIFLKEGAFVRWQGTWHVFQGPFSANASLKRHVISITYQDFFGELKSTLIPQSSFQLTAIQWKGLFKSERDSVCRPWEGPSREEYSKSFQQTQSKIADGRWQKAVPISFERSVGTLKLEEKLSILSYISDASESLIPYGFWKDGKGFIGLTPEILFQYEGSFLQTMALAGTEKKLGPSLLLIDKKNLKEHNFVVQEISEKLAKFGHVQTEGPHVLELPTLYHLQTNFTVETEKLPAPIEVMTYMHPTSALGISPHSKWRELQELPEQSKRGFFGAPLLFQLGADKGVVLVSLRQIQWNEQEAFIGAGGGVVQESQEELEWQEILAKIDSVKKLLGIE